MLAPEHTQWISYFCLIFHGDYGYLSYRVSRGVCSGYAAAQGYSEAYTINF